jgi:peptide-methionine (S)-S-oxide reductase
MRAAVAVVLAVLAWAAGPPARAQEATAIFAGGCFWCLEADLEAVRGVTDAETGYIGGAAAPRSHEEVSRGGTGHLEAVRVRYDPALLSYDRLLARYWLSVDPTDAGGQFCDRGPTWRAAIFTLDAVQATAARASRDRVAALLRRPVAVEIRPAGAFWPAEERHQDYAAKNPLRYDFYRRSCGRDAGLRAIWGATPVLALEPPRRSG